ncbi:MAG: hypothetical protein CM15mP13_2860 [Pseudomonadota bacterium]|nr:MAG: hypothetical protein CM15mP13_2860 [Pseudomonadota bacterium]
MQEQILNFENDNDDGFLTALEISRLDLRGTELFVVSGCESAMGDLRIEKVFMV